MSEMKRNEFLFDKIEKLMSSYDECIFNLKSADEADFLKKKNVHYVFVEKSNEKGRHFYDARVSVYVEGSNRDFLTIFLKFYSEQFKFCELNSMSIRVIFFSSDNSKLYDDPTVNDYAISFLIDLFSKVLDFDYKKYLREKKRSDEITKIVATLSK